MKRLHCYASGLVLSTLAAAAVLGVPGGPRGLLGTDEVVQVGIVVKDIEAASAACAALLGVATPRWFLTDTPDKAHTVFEGRPTEARAKLAFLSLKNITLELIEPVGGPSTWREFLERRGQGIHHIAFEVKGMKEKTGLLESLGMRLSQAGDYEGGRYAYVDGLPQVGMILELLENLDPGEAPRPAEAAKRSFAADGESVDSVMKAFYESISFPEGHAPDLERYRNLYFSASAPCSRTTPGAVLTTDLEGFIDNYTGRIRNGTVRSLDEREIARRTQSFGDIVQVFSSYRKLLNGAAPDKAVRGTNALQIVRRDGRWGIASIAWEDESPGRTIPPEYLK